MSYHRNYYHIEIETILHVIEHNADKPYAHHMNKDLMTTALKLEQANELLDALEGMVEYFDPGIPRPKNHIINVAKTAIAKARGQS